jgi:predicted transcriptional regulator
VIPALGPVQVAALAAVAASDDGMTVAEVAEHLGREPRDIHKAFRGLRDKACLEVLAYRRGAGVASAVWRATTTGRKALAACQQEAMS